MKNRVQCWKSVVLVVLMLASLLTASVPVEAVGGRDASMTITANPFAQSVAKGETAEYTITVKNTGSEDITVQLSTSQGGECNGYTSQVDQITEVIGAGESEQTNLRVNVTETAGESCETTVTGVGNEQAIPPGASAQEDVTVTTSVDGDATNEMWAVELLTADPISRTWGGDNLVNWEIEVKNKGRTNATITLELQDDDAPGCNPMELDGELSQTTLSIDNDSSEFVDLDIAVPEGQEAKKQCWNIHAEVTNDPQGNSTDDLAVDLTIPELHECTSILIDELLSIDPGQTKSTTITFTNTGNSQWSVNAAVSGSQANWVDFDGPSSGTLPYNTDDDTKSFDFDISPDDSLSSGDEVILTIVGKDGNGPIKCSSDLVIRLGQSHGASVGLSKAQMSNVKPGENDSTDIIVTNQGNGQEVMRVSVIIPDGWSAKLDGTLVTGVGSTTVTLGSKHGSDKQESLTLEVFVPEDALADEIITIQVTVTPNSGGIAYDMVDATVTVAPTHGMLVSTSAEDQTGKSNEFVYFPFTIENTGNTADSFRLSVIGQTTTPEWSTHFIWEDGDETPVTQISIPARTEKQAILVVKIEGEEELANTRLTVRVTNTGDSNTGDDNGDGIPDNQAEMEFRAILSNRIFLMRAEIDGNWSAVNGGQISLAPGGSDTIPVWIENIGNYTDIAYIDISGLEGMGSVVLRDANGLQLEDYLEVKKGMGIRNISTGLYAKDADGNQIVIEQSPLCDMDCVEEKVWEYIIDNSWIQSHEPSMFRALVYIEVSVSTNAENGKSGLIEFTVASKNNMIEMEQIELMVTVSTVKKIGMYHSGNTDVSLDYSKSKTFEVTLTNEGNTEFELRAFASEGLRGWVVSISEQDGIMRDGVFIAGEDVCISKTNGELLCTLDVGESVVIEVDVKPPHASEVADDFEFTFSAEPTDTGLVGRKNIEFNLEGNPVEEGIFDGLPGFTMVLSLTAMLGAALLLQRRNRV